MVSTIGSFTIAAGTLIFIFNVWKTHKAAVPALDDPWDARTLEWITPNPTPAYNYIEVPVVTHQDDFWHMNKIAGMDGAEWWKPWSFSAKDNDSYWMDVGFPAIQWSNMGI